MKFALAGWAGGADGKVSMSEKVCMLYLACRCRRGKQCREVHMPVLRELVSMRNAVHTTVLVQRAWPGKMLRQCAWPTTAVASEQAWSLIDGMLAGMRACDRMSLLAYDASLKCVFWNKNNKRQQLCHSVSSTFRTAHPRNVPDCFMQCLELAICMVCAQAQRAEQHEFHQIVVFTYTGAMGDYTDASLCTRRCSLMRATNVRVVLVGIGLRSDERASLARLCEANDLFTYFDGTEPGRDTSVALVRCAVDQHADTVLSAHRARGVQV